MKNLKYNYIGSSKIKVSNIGFGMWGLSEWKNSPSEKEAISLIKRAIKLGINFFDTAPSYGNGYGENILSKVNNKKMVIATKIPANRDKMHDINQAYTKKLISSSIENSLKRLGREYIDIIQLHNWNPEWKHFESVLKYLNEYKKSNKVKLIGISLPPIISIKRGNIPKIIKNKLIDCFQIYYNLLEDQNKPIIEAALKNKKGVFIKSPYMHGLLGPLINNIDSLKKTDIRKVKYSKEQINKFKMKIKNILENNKLSINELPEYALKSYLRLGVTSVLIGIRNRETLRKNIDYLDNLSNC